jgi:hypothetical protein
VTTEYEDFARLSFERKIAYSVVQMEIVHDLVAICPDSLAKREVAAILKFFGQAAQLGPVKRKFLPFEIQKILRRYNSESQQDHYASMSTSFAQLAENGGVTGFCLLMTIFGKDSCFEQTDELAQGLYMYDEVSLWELEEKRRLESIELLLNTREGTPSGQAELRVLAQPVFSVIEQCRESAKAKLAAIDEANRIWPLTITVNPKTWLTDRQWCAYSHAVFHSPLTPDLAALRLQDVVGFEVRLEETYEESVWGLSGNGRFFEVRTALFHGQHVKGTPKWALSTVYESFIQTEVLKCRVLQPSKDFRLETLYGLNDRFKDPAWEWASTVAENDPISAFARRDKTYGKSPWVLANEKFRGRP